MNLVVNYNDQDYVLVNLNDDQIADLQNDSEKLSEYFRQCLQNGCNICIVKSNDLTAATQPLVEVPSLRKPAAKGPRKASGKANVSIPPVTSEGLKRKSSVATEELASTKATKKLSTEEQTQLDELLATLVMEQPLLFNYKLKSAKFAGMKAEKWRIICDKLIKEFPNAEFTLTKAKDRWSTLRDDYLKRLRLKGGTGDGYMEFEEEPMDDLLSGLKDVYNIEKTASNVVEPGGSSEEYGGTSNSKQQRKNQEKKGEDGALKIIEASSEKFLSAIEDIKVSVMNKKENNNQDKAAKFCDLLLLQLRELDDSLLLKAQIEIFQVISKLQDPA